MPGGRTPTLRAFAQALIRQGNHAMITPRLVRGALCAALLAALAVPALAAAAGMPAFRVQAGAGAVTIEPALRAPAWQLRVTGPDGRFAEDTLLDGEPLRIEPKLLGYARWLDGSYQFEFSPVLGDRQRGGTVAAQAPSTRRDPDVRSSGSFRVVGGAVIVAGANEPGTLRAVAPAGSGGGTVTPADQTIPDDLIVQGSICAGFDCVDGESFGADTLRLKENNLRIHFDDTSTTAGYAANDWRLSANDQPSGGANRFMIEDATAGRVPFSVSAGAPADSVYISSNGKVGLRTSTPGLDLHMSTSDTPALRFEQTSAGGYTAQTWDIGANEANFFVRDLTGGSRLSFRIRPGAPTSSIDIAASGNVGIGIASAASALHVARATGPVALRIGRTAGSGANNVTWEVLNHGTDGRLTFSDDPAGVRVPFKIGRNAFNDLMRVGVYNLQTVDITGNLRVSGNIVVAGSVGPDYVFAPGFALPSIAEHAAQMRAARHLPKVGPAQVEDGHGLLDLGAMSNGMLEELEYAHLYIAELDGTVRQLQAQLAERDAQMGRMHEEIEAIKAAIAAD